MKHIVIKSCDDCPHKDHAGGYGQVMYIPVCKASNRKRLRYYEANGSISRGVGKSTPVMVARYDGLIPTFCPLEDVK